MGVLEELDLLRRYIKLEVEQSVVIFDLEHQLTYETNETQIKEIKQALESFTTARDCVKEVVKTRVLAMMRAINGVNPAIMQQFIDELEKDRADNSSCSD